MRYSRLPVSVYTLPLSSLHLSIQPQFVQGDHIEWLGCALYVAGQMSTMETIEGETSTGNNVSLTHILRSTKLR